jgi:hypothetical protein
MVSKRQLIGQKRRPQEYLHFVVQTCYMSKRSSKDEFIGYKVNCRFFCFLCAVKENVMEDTSAVFISLDSGILFLVN